MVLRRITAAFAAAVLLEHSATLLGAALEPDYHAAQTRLVEVLSGLVRVDTQNPPGNETLGAEYLQGILKQDGIDSEILTLAPGRGNLVARLRGNGRKKPLLLMGHTDVVGIERSKWTVNPLAALVKDGYLYGRGALDNKSMTATCLEVFRWLHALKVPLDRDVILLAEAAEEQAAPAEGIGFLVSKHWDKIACEFALNEGGRIRMVDGKARTVAVATTEKVIRSILVSAHGSSGHGSQPRIDNAVVHLCAAVAKLGQWQPPLRLNETTRVYFDRLARISPPEEAFLYTHLEDPVVGPMVQEQLRSMKPEYNSMLRTSISPNMIKAGFRFNVIPADGLATLDVRWLPDEEVEPFLAMLRKVVDDPAVEITLTEPGIRKAAAPSSLNTEMFQALERAQRTVFPEAVTLPTMLTGATDSAPLREKGVQAYGLGSPTTDGDFSRIHGNDERVSIEGLGQFLRFVYTAVVDVAGSH